MRVLYQTIVVTKKSESRTKPNPPKRRRRYWLYGVSALLLIWWFFPQEDAERWRRGAPATWSYRAQQEQQFLQENNRQARVRYNFVPLETIALDMQVAAMVGEDIGFFFHGTVDFDELQNAVFDWYEGKRLRGASTISQQLAKNLFLSQDRSFLRKLDELRLAWWLERSIGKRRILELYLNVIELGPNIYGVEAASQYYFGTSAAALTLEQAASLAATIPSPLKSNPQTGDGKFRFRRRMIQRRMRETAYLREYLDRKTQQ